MSAFVMLPEGFNNLANELAARAEDSNNTCDLDYAIKNDIRVFLQLGWDTPSEERANKAAFETVTTLFNANVEAVSQRYAHMSEAERGHYELPAFARTRYWPQWTPVQLLKHLTCLRYQMSEGNVPETPIYSKLSKLISDIALSIVTHMPEYAAASWDFKPSAVAA